MFKNIKRSFSYLCEEVSPQINPFTTAQIAIFFHLKMKIWVYVSKNSPKIECSDHTLLYDMDLMQTQVTSSRSPNVEMLTVIS